MAKDHNTKQDIKLAEIEKDLDWIKGKIANIEKAVFNEIPHTLEQMRKEYISYISDILKVVVFGIIVAVASSLLLQIILKFFK
jgi:uncharacterized membrane protein YraQ (UPF0718 family)